MANKHEDREHKAGAVKRAAIRRFTLEEFREKNPDAAWVGTKDASGKYYQFGGLGDRLEGLELPEGTSFSPSDFTGTSPKNMSAAGVDLRDSIFDSSPEYRDFGQFEASGTKFGGAWMPEAIISAMHTDSSTSFYDPASGGACLKGSVAEHMSFHGDLRDVDAEDGRWPGVQMGAETRTIGLNLLHADVDVATLENLTDQNLAGIKNLDLAANVDPATFEHWAELTHYYETPHLSAEDRNHDIHHALAARHVQADRPAHPVTRS